MFGLGFGEMVMIGLVVLIFVGPERLPEFMRMAGRMYAQVRRASEDLRRAFTEEADRQDAEERLAKLQERRKLAEESRRRAEEQRKRAAERGAVARDEALPPPPADAKPAPAEADDDPEAPAPRRSDPPKLAVVPDSADRAGQTRPSGPPPGISQEEWDALPPHIRDMLSKRRAG